MTQRRSHSGGRDYPRTARVNELLREIIGDAMERIDDTRLSMVSVTGVEVDTELTLAKVWVSALDDDPTDALVALETHRGAFKRAIGEQACLRRTPDLVFAPDPGVAGGGRVEEILQELADAGELERTEDDGPGA